MNHKIFLGVVLATTAAAAEAQFVVADTTLTSQNAGANRFRNFGNAGGGDNYLGVNGLGDSNNRVEDSSIHWTKPYSHAFSFVYDVANDRLISEVTYLAAVPDAPITSTLVYSNFLSNVANRVPSVANLDWNALQISLTMASDGNSTPAQFNLRNVKFNGSNLNVTDFFGVLGQTKDWTIQGYNFRNGFSLTGTIELDGAFGSGGDLNAINLGFGNIPGAVPEPFTMGLGIAAAGAFVRRRLKSKNL
ncbi:MAG: PEP-CTERM sorting domain-containing protein [Methanoregulaceae archaeon]|nr:PEP-CTERM sorting domain-containing protein [Methanoregulaceae archaeon]